MNWLAHLVLSERSSAFRLGNLLPDLMTRAELAVAPEIFQRGIECHRRIDAFTDRHPVVRRSVRRVSPAHRRFAPILMDIFYDHYLSVHWARHCAQPLAEFVQEIYTSFNKHGAQLPPTTRSHLERMRVENWLSSYREIDGVRLTLDRISQRLRRRVELGAAVVELVQNYTLLEADFAEFFPELRAHVETRAVSPHSSSSS
jgi:acyl carrier protein phosphodiesterase